MSKYEFDLEEKLQRLVWLWHRYTRKHHQGHGPMADTSRGQGRVLAALKMQPEISTRDLAYLLGIRTQSLNELLSKLEKAEFITRKQADEDKRVILVQITEKGRQEEQQKSEFTAIFDSLNEDEQKNFSAYVDRIIAALEAEIGEDQNDEDAELLRAAKDRLGDNFERLLAMRHGGNPFRHGRGGFDDSSVPHFGHPHGDWHWRKPGPGEE
jgi:DNA-binding MarR family transcriptional regulator